MNASDKPGPRRHSGEDPVRSAIIAYAEERLQQNQVLNGMFAKMFAIMGGSSAPPSRAPLDESKHDSEEARRLSASARSGPSLPALPPRDRSALLLPPSPSHALPAIDADSQPLPPGSARGTISQYNVSSGKSACASIAIRAADAMLRGALKTPDDVDAVVANGVMDYVQVGPILRSNPEYEGLNPYDENGYLSFDYAFFTSPFCRQLTVDLFEEGGMAKQLEIAPKKDGESVTTFYLRLLETFQLAAETKKVPVAGILTIDVATYAIQYDPHTSIWRYFNSHGTNAVYGNTAMLFEFRPSGEEFVNGRTHISFLLDETHPEPTACGVYLLT